MKQGFLCNLRLLAASLGRGPSLAMVFPSNFHSFALIDGGVVSQAVKNAE